MFGFAEIIELPGEGRYATPGGHVIEAHPARPRVESAYVSVHDTDGMFLCNYQMDSTAEAIEEAWNIAYAYSVGRPY